MTTLSARLLEQAEYLDTHRHSAFSAAGSAALMREAAVALREWHRKPPIMLGMIFESDCIVNGQPVKAGTEVKFVDPDTGKRIPPDVR